MFRPLDVSSGLGTFGLVTFLVLLPIAALLFGILMLALVSSIF